ASAARQYAAHARPDPNRARGEGPACRRSGCGRPRGLDASGGGRCDRDRLLLGLLGERDRHFDDTVVRLGLDAVGLNARGQRHRAAEGPVAALAPHIVLVLLFLVLLVLTGDREDVVLDLDLDLLGLDPGDV